MSWSLQLNDVLNLINYESPVIDDIYLLENGTNTVVDPNNVTGPVDIVMKAHDEITDGGSNAGIYKVGYRIESEEINKYQFDNWLTPDCINYVYAEGSNTSTFKYIVTNNACSDDCWDPPGTGWYTIWVYAYDIKDHWDLDFILVQVTAHGIEEPSDTNKAIVYSLSQNFPNPFSKRTVINYSIASKGDVRLWIYDISGRLVRKFWEENKNPGHYKVMWDGRNELGEKVPAGIYFTRLHSGGFNKTKKMILVQ